MLNNYFKYYKTDSFIHSINPLCKILMSIIFIVISIFSFSFKSVIALLIVMTFIVGLSNIPYKVIFEPLFKMKFFLLILFIIGLVFGFKFSVCFVFKFSIIFLYYIILVKSTKIDDFVRGFYYLLYPFKIFNFSIVDLAVNCSLFINCFSFFIDEYNLIYKSQISKNVYKDDFKRKVYMIVQSISYAYRNILKKRDLIILRGFNFYDEDYKWRLSDAYVVMCNLVILVLVLVKEVVM